MSRKTASFTQLFEYMMRENPSFCFTHNLYASVSAKEDILREFHENALYIKSSRGKNFLYHEIVSLPANELDRDREQEILRELSQAYIELRGKDHLVFGVMHHAKDHLHIHLMISANALGASRRKRMSKAQFARVQKTIESYKNAKYPELVSSHYQNGKTQQKPKQKEQEMKTRRKQKSRKDQIKESLQEIMKTSYLKRQFQSGLIDSGFEWYERGKTVGVIHEGKKYRLKTLGLEEEYQSMLQKIEKRQFEKEERKSRREQRKTSKRRDELHKIVREKDQGFER